MNYKFLGLVALLAAPMAANAQTEILDYTGSPFSSVSFEGNDAGAPNPAQNTGELVLSSPSAITSITLLSRRFPFASMAFRR
jgi:hypothetical protein